MPRIRATPVRRPIDANRPSVLNWKGIKASPANARDDVVREHLAFARGMLRGRWLIPTLSVRNHGAVTERPYARATLNFHRGIHLEAIAVLGQIQLIK
jgi:hypothetical protein